MAVGLARSRSDIAHDIAELGVKPGAVVMLHVSLRAIGSVEGGAEGVLDAVELTLGGNGTSLMVLGANDDWAWVNSRPENEREALLRNAEPFDPKRTPADPEVGYLAEVFRRRSGTLVTHNPEGRFGARGKHAADLLANAPWNDYFGPDSPLDRLCRLDGSVLRIGADPDTTTLLHWSEYLANLKSARRVRRHRRVLTTGGPEIRTVECLNDDGEGIIDWPGEDYFKTILDEYLIDGRAACGRVGSAESQLLSARDFAEFGARWMVNHFA